MTDDINHLPAQTIKDIQKGHTYLISTGNRYSAIHSITVLTITDKAYQLRWNENNISWDLKERLYHEYELIEDISDFQTYQEPIKLKFSTKYVTCTACAGMGSIQDFNSTAGTKLCPLCQGSKTIPQVTEVQS
jgi:hypothetical protein